MQQYPKIPYFEMGLTDYIGKQFIIQEKYDGSLFRVSIEDGNLCFGSKAVDYTIDNMFEIGIKNSTKQIEFIMNNTDEDFDGYTFFFEFIRDKKHNTLKYATIPRDNLILLDVYAKDKGWIDYDSLYENDYFHLKNMFQFPKIISKWDYSHLTIDVVNGLLLNESSLGGTKIEGIVFKCYEMQLNRYTKKYEPIFFKFVQDEFKEMNRSEWNKKAGHGHIFDKIEKTYHNTNRFDKVIQRMRDEGLTKEGVKSIPKLVKYFEEDIDDELSESIKKELYEHNRRHLMKLLSRGLIDYYKKYLMEGKK